jgi:DNA-binding transcriptional ArsR family regulator
MRLGADDHLDEALLALGDGTRRAILQRLSRGETRVTELAAPFEMSLNGVSKHIRILERAGLVNRRVLGREHLLSLNARPLDDVAKWIETNRTLWKARLARLERVLDDPQSRP